MKNQFYIQKKFYPINIIEQALGNTWSSPKLKAKYNKSITDILLQKINNNEMKHHMKYNARMRMKINS